MKKLWVVAIFGLLGGCAELNTVQYKFGNWNREPYVATIDAKQRVIVAVPPKEGSGGPMHVNSRPILTP